MTKVKICGITNESDVEYINELLPDYAGFVMFFSKSKRNLSEERAKELLSITSDKIKKVAVTVCPSAEQLKTIVNLGFDIVQIHGKADKSVISTLEIPVFKAFNVSDFEDCRLYEGIENVQGFVFDAAEPGSGKTFDWETLKEIPRGKKLLALAGGLNCKNVRAALKEVKPDIADVSSGVENNSGNGKDKEKLRDFISAVRNV